MTLRKYGMHCVAAGCLALATAGAMAEGHKAAATFVDRQGNEIGTASLTGGPNGTLIRIEIDGLPEGWKAIHIHEIGTCDDPDEGFEASGEHLNPDDRPHGLMNPDGPDAGDLPNLYADSQGRVRAEMFTTLASLDGSVGARILDDDGAALIIHENPDDHHSQPIGGSGARIACAVIAGTR
jgi:superoxide dismutase, Cu-Zn family